MFMMNTITKEKFYEDGINLDELISSSNIKTSSNFTIKKEQILVLSVAGSHMYGLDTPDSDKDYLGVFIPTKEQLLLNNFPRQVKLPKSSGLDLQMWSIHYFLKLACQGETMAIDLLHAPYDCWLIYSDAWKELVNNRTKFFTREMKSYISYTRKQAAKYGIKGTRMDSLTDVINFLEGFDPSYKLFNVWEHLPTGEHIHFIDAIEPDPYRMYQVCGKKFQETVMIGYALKGLKKSLTEYGKRAKLAQDNNGIDWKAISHALRTAFQVRDILRYGDYEYPLNERGFLKSVKKGKQDFMMFVQPELEQVVKQVEELIEKSTLPYEVDIDFWKQWLINLLKKHVL